MPYRMPKVFIGDVGNIEPIMSMKEEVDIPSDEQIENMTIAEMADILLRSGIKVSDLIGVRKCSDHVGMVLTIGRALPQGMTLFEHVRYCKKCFQWFREARL